MINEKVTILHTNDLHSHIFRLPKIKKWLTKRTNELKREGVQVIIVDDGDFVDRSDDNTQASWGRDNSLFLDDAEYRFATIGNNEGIAFPKDRLNKMYSDRKVEILLSNLKDTSGNTPSWAKNDSFFITENDTKIMLTGLTMDYPTYPLVGWNVLDPYKIITEYNNRKNEFDVFVLLSHLGYSRDVYIAENNPNIDIIIGAHTHHLLESGESKNNSILAAAGKYGEYIGEISLEISDNQITEKIAKVIKVDDLPEEESDSNWVNKWHEKGRNKLLKKVITKLPVDLKPEKQTLDFSEALKKHLNTSISMISTGMFLKELKKGELSELDLLEDLPHSINLMKVTFHGVELKRFLSEIESQKKYLKNTHISGSGFRGDKFGEIIIDGINEDEIEDNEIYTIGTISHYLFLPYFRTIANFGEIEFDYSLIMRELFAIYYKEKYK